MLLDLWRRSLPPRTARRRGCTTASREEHGKETNQRLTLMRLGCSKRVGMAGRQQIGPRQRRLELGKTRASADSLFGAEDADDTTRRYGPACLGAASFNDLGGMLSSLEMLLKIIQELWPPPCDHLVQQPHQVGLCVWRRWLGQMCRSRRSARKMQTCGSRSTTRSSLKAAMLCASPSTHLHHYRSMEIQGTWFPSRPSPSGGVLNNGEERGHLVDHWSTAVRFMAECS
ncbi:uncharacterized protein [Lolium perenne]|uniref:uncharacterized protein isoform X1 n=1 Tax=Lolium perenne TaxID=4522 RepID=UPI003A996C36